jgi:hypothetical protein
VENCVLFPPSGIVKASKLGGVPVFLTSAAPGQLAVDAFDLYYDDGKLAALSKLGGLPWTLAGAEGGALAVDDAYVYLVSAPGIVRVPKLGGASELVAVDPRASAIAVDSRNVYWLDFGVSDGELVALTKPR